MNAIPIRVEHRVCRCGCGHPVTAGRKFLNQKHYDSSKGLSSAGAEQLLACFRQGVPVLQLTLEFGVAHSTIYRLLKKHGLM